MLTAIFASQAEGGAPVILTVTPLYAGLLAFLYLFLAFSVIRQRRRRRISLGDGGDARFLRLIRGHANFAEYVPLALILMALAELSGAGSLVPHGMGLLLLAGRLAHGWSFVFTERNLTARTAGMVLTIASIVVGATACLKAGLGL